MPRASELPVGWRRLSPSENRARGFNRRAERYLAPDGRDVSRRQAENVIARQAGWDSWSEYQRAAQTRTYRKQLEVGVEGLGLPDRPSSYRRLAGPRSRISQAYKRFMDEGSMEGRWSESHSTAPGSPWAQMLEAEGVRDENATYEVGDTP